MQLRWIPFLSAVLTIASLPAGAQLKLAWKQPLPANVRRVAVADTIGDGKQRLVLLVDGDKAGTRAVAVAKWSGEKWETEFTSNAPDLTDRLAVGVFAPGKPAIIVTNTAIWYWNGTGYQMKTATESIPLLGMVTLKDGSQRLLINEPKEMKLCRVDPEKDKWLVGGDAPASAANTQFLVYKGIPTELTTAGLPNVLAAGGVVGLWEAKKSTNYLFAVENIVEKEIKGGIPKSPTDLVIKNRELRLALLDPKAPDLKNGVLWRSEKLDGGALDVTLNDPHGSGAAGLAVLTDGSLGGRGHTLYFFKLE